MKIQSDLKVVRLLWKEQETDGGCVEKTVFRPQGPRLCQLPLHRPPKERIKLCLSVMKISHCRCLGLCPGATEMAGQ